MSTVISFITGPYVSVILGSLSGVLTALAVSERAHRAMTFVTPGRGGSAGPGGGASTPGGNGKNTSNGAAGGAVSSGLSVVRPSAPPPRGSGAGMTGFAEKGEQDFEFAVGRVRGLRQWTLNSPDFRGDPHQAGENWEKAYLKGATGYFWESAVQEAKCNNGYKHDPPAEYTPGGSSTNGQRCGCGFWAYWDLFALSSGGSVMSGSGLSVIGVIEGTGRTLIGDRGFRSQKARIVGLAPAFSIVPEVWPPKRRRDSYQYRGDSFRDDPYSLGRDPYLEFSRERKEDLDEEKVHAALVQQAQQHADAWMAMIQDRLGEMYPDTAVFATVAGLVASCPPEGRELAGRD